MAAPKRTEAERERDLVEITSMYLQGFTQQHIAEAISKERPYSIGHKTIARDIKTLLERWRHGSFEEIGTAKRRELARLNVVEAEAWSEWHRSKLPIDKTLSERREGEQGVSTTARTQRENRIADPRFLQIVQNCVEARGKILGFGDDFVQRLERLEKLLCARN